MEQRIYHLTQIRLASEIAAIVGLMEAHSICVKAIA